MVGRKPQGYELAKFIQNIYQVRNKQCALHGVLSARDTWFHHSTSRVKLAHVQSVSNCNEWLFQEVQGRVSQLEFIIIAVAS